jgi:hypothetical protein
MAEDDARDEPPDGSMPERLEGLLDVEPLDEVTRRRLVTTAVRASAAPERSHRWVAAAAAVVALAVGGGVALVATSGDDTTAPTALDEQRSKAAPPNTTPPAAGANAPTSEAATPTDAGDFGDLSDASNRARARAALGTGSGRQQTGGAASGAADAAAATASSYAARLDRFPCAGELSEGTVVATGTGRFGNREAVVVAIERPDGTRTIEAVVDDPCEVRPLD